MRKYIFLLSLLSFAGTHAQVSITIGAMTDSILQNNYAIRVSRVEAEIAENNNTPGRAGAIPQLNFNASQANSFYDTRQEFYSGDIREAENAANSNLTASLRLDWTVFAGFRVQATRDFLRIQSELAQLNTIISLEEQLFSASSLFYEILLRDKLIVSYEQALQISRDRRKLADDRLRLGRGSQLDVLQSLVDFNADSSALIREKIYRENLVVRLNTMMGRNGDDPLVLEGTINVVDMPVLPTVIETALNQNTQVLFSKARKLLAYSEIRQAKSSLYPRLGVYGEYYFLQSQSQVGLLKSNQALGPGVGVALSYRLFDGFNVQTDIKNARLRMEIQDLQLEGARKEVRAAVIQAYNNYLLNRQLWIFEKENVVTAEKNLAISKKQLELGVITDLAFRESQLRYTEAVSREIESQYRAKVSELELNLLSANLLQSLKS